MGFSYTKEQKQVIETSGSNILVSAAAGSGKTAVLVQRIISMITDKTKMVSIDELLIVTFTRAAAAEMRERIGDGIEKAIELERDEVVVNHLIKQLTLLPAANIMNMHSFCLKILKSYYHLIGLDPTFRIGNETELVLMKEEVIDDLLEEEYEKQEAKFIQVVESFADGKDDQKIKDLVFKIHNFSISNPWPEEWMEEGLSQLNIQSIKDYEASIYFQVLISEVEENLIDIENDFQEIYDLMRLDEGPDKYMDTVEVLHELQKAYLSCIKERDISLMMEIKDQTSIPALSRKTKGYNKELAAEAKARIDSIKKVLTQSSSIFYNKETIIGELGMVYSLVEELIHLTKIFKNNYQLRKDEKNLIDFSDIEHFTLKLLYTDGAMTGIAETFKKQFVEVLVDEYQDTNEVQEAIIQALSKEDNLFMVGDLKQSIYKFRLAKPEIFREKYDRFDYEDSQNIKIDLAKNFRSRNEIIRFANEIFENVMSKSIGDVDYDEHAKLYYGSLDYEESLDDRYLPELILSEPDEVLSKELLQGQIVADKIKEMMSDDSFKIFDKESGEMRPLMYKDICVLMRSPSTTIAQMKDVFDQRQIPYQSDVSSGFFDAVEVSIVMNILRIIDNPYQDIPLTSVLRSGIVGLDEKQLLSIREFNKELSFYQAFCGYIEAGLNVDQGDVDAIVDKGSRFLKSLGELRELSLRLPLDQLIQKIYSDTGYPYFVRFMENGEQRLVNLKYLQVQAQNFEQSSYKGLFNFIRYIEHIKKYEINIPEPLVNSSDAGVTFLSIHKSKGLEFPVVFLINIHKEFNTQDLKQNFMLHQDLGFGCDYFNTETRQRKESVFTKALKKVGTKELLSEELRLLYVAVTRAREKLYLVGVIKDMDKVLERQEYYTKFIQAVPPLETGKAKTYLDWMLMSCPYDVSWYHFNPYDAEAEVMEQGETGKVIQEEKDSIIELLLSGQSYDKDISDLELMNQAYTYEEQTKKYVTMSVSELKESRKREAFGTGEYQTPVRVDGDEHMTNLKEKINMEKPVPEFIEKKDKTLQGAVYGLVMHKVLSLLPPKADYTFDEIKDYVDMLIDKEIIEEEFRGKVYIKPILTFTCSKFYKRIVEAAQRKELYMEQPFVLGLEDKGDLRMIQGVIDLYLEEDGDLVLLDYKTDYIEEDNEEELVKRYKVQLDYYQKALEDITGKKVKEVYIYSLSIGKLINLSDTNHLIK